MIAAIRTLVSKSNSFLERLTRAIMENIAETMEFAAYDYYGGKPKDPERAEELYLKRRIIADKITFGKESRYREFGLVRLAEFYRKRYRFAEAERYYMDAYHLCLKDDGDKQVVALSRTLVDFFSTYYKHEMVEYCARTALTLIAKNPAADALPDAPDSNPSRNKEKALESVKDEMFFRTKRGQALEQLGRYSEAEAEYCAVADIAIARVGLLSDITLGCLSALQQLYNRSDNAKAEKIESLIRLIHYVMFCQARDFDCPTIIKPLRELATFVRSTPYAHLSRSLEYRADMTEAFHRVNRDARPTMAKVKPVADWLRKRNHGGDATIAHRLEHRVKILDEKARLKR